MEIKNETLNFNIEIEIGCTEPESFTSQEDFRINDAAEMKHYLTMLITEAVMDRWQYAAEVVGIKFNEVKSVKQKRLIQ